MFRRFSVNFAIFSIFMDALIISLSLVCANQLRPLLNFLPFASDVRKPMQLPGILYPLFLATWIGLFMLIAVYDGRRNLRVTDEMRSVAFGSLLAGVALAGMLYLTYRDVSRVLFLVFILIAFTGLASWRLVARTGFRISNQRNSSFRRVLVIGAGKIGRDMKEKVLRYSYLGIQFIGFLDDDPKKLRNNPLVLGSLNDARRIINDEKIDDVVIALPQYAHAQLNRLVAELHDLSVKVLVIPDYYHLALHKAVVEEFAGIQMLDLRAPALNDFQRLVKRGFDLAFSILILPLSSIIMLAIAILIRLESPGPILFKQKRVGENGLLFDIYKFRTMVPDAENQRYLVEVEDDQGHLIHKVSSDPRVTRIGHILRKFSLDELPQLWNVIKGDMSIIGPRPELPYLVDEYEPWQRIRFAVPQGMTGWWQVNGRSDKPMHLNTEDDLYYVQNYSLFLDFLILLKTLGVVIRGKGAF